MLKRYYFQHHKLNVRIFRAKNKQFLDTLYVELNMRVEYGWMGI